MGSSPRPAATAAAMLLLAAAVPIIYTGAQEESTGGGNLYNYGYGDGYDYVDYQALEEYGDYEEGEYEYDYEHMPGDCEVLDESVVKVNGTQACDVRLSGSNQGMDTLATGLDGIYEITGCFAGHPLYTRKNSPIGSERTLFFDPLYLDWNVVDGESTSPLDHGELFGFGGSGIGEERPQLVVSDGDDWVLATDYSTEAQEADTTNPWFNADIQLTCENQVGVNVRFEGKVLESQVASNPHVDDATQAWDSAIMDMEEQLEQEPKEDPYKASTLSSKANDDWYASHGEAIVTTTGSAATGTDEPTTSGTTSKGAGHVIVGVVLLASVVAGVGGYVFWVKRNSARPLNQYDHQLPNLSADDEEGNKLLP